MANTIPKTANKNKMATPKISAVDSTLLFGASSSSGNGRASVALDAVSVVISAK